MPTPISFAQWQANQKGSTATSKTSAIPFSQWQAQNKGKTSSTKNTSSMSSVFGGLNPNKSFTGITSKPNNSTDGSTPQQNSSTDTMGIIKNIGAGLVSSEVGAGQDIAAAIGGGKYIDQLKKLSASQQQDITSLVNLRNKYAKVGDTKNTDRINTMIKNENVGGASITDMFPALNKSTEQVIGDFAGLGLDVVTAGTVGPELKAGESGAEAVKGATTGKRIISGVKTGTAIGAGYGAAGGAQANENPMDLAKSTAIGAVSGAVAGGTLGGVFGKKASSLAKTTEDVSPRLSASEAENATTKTSKITKKISVVPSKKTTAIANSVHDTIKSGTTFSDKANLADKGIQTEAESLKSQIKNVDHPVPKRELVSNLTKVEKPVLISSDRTMNTAFSQVVSKAKDIVAKTDGTISGMLDGRKSFDDFVSKQFPNLYDSDTLTPMRTAIKSIRGEWNDFIEKQLPNNVAFKDSLNKQSNLFEARDILREKAARGAPTKQGEIGTNRFGRFFGRHPLLKKAGKAAVAGVGVGLGGGATYEAGKKLGL